MSIYIMSVCVCGLSPMSCEYNYVQFYVFSTLYFLGKLTQQQQQMCRIVLGVCVCEEQQGPSMAVPNKVFGCGKGVCLILYGGGGGVCVCGVPSYLSLFLLGLLDKGSPALSAQGPINQLVFGDFAFGRSGRIESGTLRIRIAIGGVLKHVLVER